MQEDGVLPDTGLPHVDGKATRNSQRTTRTRCNHDHLIHHISFVHGRRLGGYTFQGSILERFEFVEEVVVLVTVVEVGVHDDGRGTRDGSGTRSFSERYLTNPTFSGQR